ncbi:unnamed protein product [Durusdinium trenchii]|uniref:Protein kinase domain-containing protein n=1 Tax=Durusdinium trenchii TaxID=1381693 RepID=A0ABP0S9W2_9DINO
MMRLRDNMIRAAIRQFCCCCCAKKVTGCVDLSQEAKEDAAVFVGKPIEELEANQTEKEPRDKVQEEPQVPGVVPAESVESLAAPRGSDRLPVLELPDGDACGLQIFELLGRGASGCRVHRCQEGGRIMAGKVLPLGPATFPDMVEDLENELSVLKVVGEHPALVSFLGAWSTKRFVLDKQEQKAYVVGIELCGTNLEDVLQKRKEMQKPLEQSEMLPILNQVSKALVHLHRHRVMHRDLKAGNVFLCSSGEELDLPRAIAKLGDFGVAKVCSRAQTPVQTPHFMAPEVAKQSEYGPAADIWAFGCLMLQMMQLSLPHGEDLTLPQLEEALLAGTLQLSQREEALERSPRVVAAMDRCLQKDPMARPTAEELSQELDDAVSATC